MLGHLKLQVLGRNFFGGKEALARPIPSVPEQYLFLYMLISSPIFFTCVANT